MVIERFRDPRAIYERLRDLGRLMPEGLSYLDSWIASDLSRCFQLMECEDPKLLDEWMAGWDDLMELDVVPIVSSVEASALALSD
jgi:hypothetical protein